MELPVTNLDEPESSRLLRKIDDLFVESLKQRLKQDPSGPGVPPLAVVCKTVTKKEAFQDRLKDVYRYEVQGGLHGAKARQALFSENPEMTMYARAYCTVYCGLSDEEALRLASRHNVNGHFIHKMTHRDYVSTYIVLVFFYSWRYWLFCFCIQNTVTWSEAFTLCIYTCYRCASNYM